MGKLNRWGSCRQVRFPTNGNKFEGWGSCTTSSKSLCILFENVDLSYSGIRAQSLGQGPGICILTSLSYTPVFGNFWSGYCFYLARSHGNFWKMNQNRTFCFFSVQLRTKSVHWLIGTSNHFFINALSFCMYCYHFKENTTSILNVEKLILCLYWLQWNLQVVWIVDFFTTKNSVYHLAFLEIIGLFIASFVDFLANMKW